MSFKLEVTGTSKAVSKFQRMRIMIPIMVSSAFLLEAELTMTQAKRLCPVDTGRLRASGRVNTPSISAIRIVVTLGFYTDYAVYVHERLDASHPVGQVKFLEVAVRMRLRSIERGLQRAMKKALMT